MPEAALGNWQPVWNAQVSILTPVCVEFELCPGAGDIHICWFNFDALAQGNAYKPRTNRWIIVDSVGIELTTSRLRHPRHLPVVQHVRFMPLKLFLKTQSQWHARGCTEQLTTRLECTGVNRLVSQMRAPLTACRKPAGKLWQLCKV